MTDKERKAVLDRVKKDLLAAGFDNVVILANEGGAHGTIDISCFDMPVLMRLIMASILMDETMDCMVEEDSTAMTAWKLLYNGIFDTVLPQIRKQEEALRDGNRVSKIVSFGKGKD